MLETIRQFNWIDLFVIIILIRTAYVAYKVGFTFECFKLLGVIFAIYLPMHYYIGLSDRIVQILPLSKKNAPLELVDFLSFLILALVGYGIFLLVRLVFHRFIQMKALPQLNKWGGLAIGVARGVLLSGLILFILVVSGVDYLKRSVTSSYSGRAIVKIAPATYSFLWYGLFSKFMPNEEFNQTIQDIEQSAGL